MGELDHIRDLFNTGNTDRALGLLASILIKNNDHLDAWLLMGELIDDPSKKKDCYRQVLRLSPGNAQALTKLQELRESSPMSNQIVSPEEAPTVSKRARNELRQRLTQIPVQTSYPSREDSRNGIEIIGYVIGGIAGFLLILYIIVSPGETSSDQNSLYLGLLFLSLIAGVIILTVSSKNRG